MQIETDAIVLHCIKYSETSVIAHLYTEEFGNGAYIMNSVRTNRSKMAMFQPLSLVKVNIIRKKEAQQIHRITNIGFTLVPTSISGNIYKSTIALFIGEILNRVFKEEEKNEFIFKYIQTFITLLEESKQDFSDLHILFLLHLTQFLGVFPNKNFDITHPIFSLQQAQFVTSSNGNETLSTSDSALLATLLETNEITDFISLSQTEKQTALSILLRYYDFHICKTQNIKSLEVLKMVFS